MPHDCPDACGVLITIDDGRAIKVKGDPAIQLLKASSAPRLAKYLDRVYSPDRVLYPMRRVAPKGSLRQAVAVSRMHGSAFPGTKRWGRSTGRFRQITRDFGSEAILPYSYGGTLGDTEWFLDGPTLLSPPRRFAVGAINLFRSGRSRHISVLGVKLGTEPEQFRDSRYIIAWGANIHRE